MKGYLFPGQGTQFPGMGKDLYDQYQIAKNIFDSKAGYDFSRRSDKSMDHSRKRSVVDCVGLRSITDCICLAFWKKRT